MYVYVYVYVYVYIYLIIDLYIGECVLKRMDLD
jgi:hypothetical protein